MINEIGYRSVIFIVGSEKTLVQAILGKDFLYDKSYYWIVVTENTKLHTMYFK